MAKLPHTLPPLKTTLKSLYPLLVSATRVMASRKIRYVSVVIVLLLSSVVGGIYFIFIKDLPSVQQLTLAPLPQTTHIKDRNGQTLYKIYSNQNRTLISLQELPPYVTQAFIAIEDRDFYSHPGFSTKGIARAALTNIKNFIFTCKFKTQNCEFTSIQGGSTITQQLVKTALLTPDRTLARKLRELFLSINLESKLSKNEIFEMYLNRIGFGGAVYGIEEASQTYFGIPASKLSLAQAALIAGLPAAPSAYSPYGSYPEAAKARQQEVLRRMVDAGFISADQASAASAQKLTFKSPDQNIASPHFVMYIKSLLAEKYGSQAVEMGGLDVTTTLDLPLQEAVQKIVAVETAKIKYLHITNGAALVTNPQTGEILAMVGSRDYFDVNNDGNVNVTLRPRQPGSSIKPLNYALGFQNGLSPATIIDDTPITYRIPGQPVYAPVNYDGRYHGRVTLRTALGSSYNIPAVKVLEKNGVKQFIDFAKNLGITTWTDPNRYGLSLTLGGGEVLMTDLATAYSVFANLGEKVPLDPILEVRDAKGKILERHPCYEYIKAGKPCHGQSVVDPRVAYQITDILSDNSARAPTFGSSSQLYIPNRQVAVKTGTTNSLRDNWTIGYTPNVLVAVWVGNNDNTPMSYVASGVTGASPIWRQIIDYQLPKIPALAFTTPAGLDRLQLKCGSGQDYFVPGTYDVANCPSPTPAIKIASAPDYRQ